MRVRLESQDTAEAEEYPPESELGERGRWEQDGVGEGNGAVGLGIGTGRAG